MSSLPVVSGEVATDISILCEILNYGGPYWDRTSDPHNVNVVLYR